MYLLAIETTGAFASVALLEDDCVLEHIQGDYRFSHLQNLMPQVKEVLENHKLLINDVSAIAVSKAPWLLYGDQDRSLFYESTLPGPGGPGSSGIQPGSTGDESRRLARRETAKYRRYT